jgi:hypothetical protein
MAEKTGALRAFFFLLPVYGAHGQGLPTCCHALGPRYFCGVELEQAERAVAHAGDSGDQGIAERVFEYSRVVQKPQFLNKFR